MWMASPATATSCSGPTIAAMAARKGQRRGGYGSPDYTIDVLNALSSVKRYADVDPAAHRHVGPLDGRPHHAACHGDDEGHQGGRDLGRGGGVLSRPDEPVAAAGANQCADSRARRWRDDFVDRYGSPELNPAFWADISPSSYLADLSGPLQLHHGTADESVPTEFSQTLYQQAQAAELAVPVEYYEYPGDNHNLSKSFNTAMQRSIAFFDKYVKNAAPPGRRDELISRSPMQQTLLALFAHPDDEAFGTGGTLSQYAAAGADVTLVCTTRGEVGEIAEGTGATPETLGEVREAELRCAAETVGVHELIFWATATRGWPARRRMPIHGRMSTRLPTKWCPDSLGSSGVCGHRSSSPSSRTAVTVTRITSPSTTTPSRLFTPRLTGRVIRSRGRRGRRRACSTRPSRGRFFCECGMRWLRWAWIRADSPVSKKVVAAAGPTSR